MSQNNKIGKQCKQNYNDVVDDFMRRLYTQSKGKIHQVLVADYLLGNRLRHSIYNSYPVSRRPVELATKFTWLLFSQLVGPRIALRINALIWVFIGLPSLFFSCLKMHSGSFSWEGASDASIVLLRTGVSNEPRIAKWAQAREGGSVSMLSLNGEASWRLSALRFLPMLFKVHFKVCHGALADMIQLVENNTISKHELTFSGPAWMIQLCSRAKNISWSYLLAKTYLLKNSPSHLYFTMNSSYESGFMHALRGTQATYVEHGFPLRDIPPLVCRQFVYSDAYRRYLLSFDQSLDAKTIGLEYFPNAQIEPRKIIVVASLQDWAQFTILQVKDLFNDALEFARKHGWKIVFRTRTYDTDAFAIALNGPWDNISEAKDESFEQCLERVRPDMVWTTWSTAVLDATAKGVRSVAFATEELNNYFVLDLADFATVITPNNNEFSNLTNYLESFGEVTTQQSTIKN